MNLFFYFRFIAMNFSCRWCTLSDNDFTRYFCVNLNVLQMQIKLTACQICVSNRSLRMNARRVRDDQNSLATKQTKFNDKLNFACCLSGQSIATGFTDTKLFIWIGASMLNFRSFLVEKFACGAWQYPTMGNFPPWWDSLAWYRRDLNLSQSKIHFHVLKFLSRFFFYFSVSLVVQEENFCFRTFLRFGTNSIVNNCLCRFDSFISLSHWNVSFLPPEFCVDNDHSCPFNYEIISHYWSFNFN